MKTPLVAAVMLAALMLGALMLPAHALTVVELFQSQGCSSCPPAIANVNAVSGRSDILALMFAVTYWDRLGWKDTFAKPQFTDRQYAYGRKFGNGVYTPEVVINGRGNLVGSEKRKLDAAIDAAQPLHGPSLRQAARSVTVGAAQGSADVWLVRYDPRAQKVPIGAGENGGVTITHKNIVRALVRLGNWSGAAKQFSVPVGGDPAWRSAVLVQQKNGGPILAALKIS